MQKLLTILLTTCLTIATHAAANGIDGELLVKVGTTGNKAIPTSQTTNVTISATSKVTDGASAVAFSLNSSNVLSTSGAKLLTVGNGGTNVAFQHYGGGWDLGRNVGPYWNPDPSDMFVAVWDASTGEPTTGHLYLAVTDNANSETKNGVLQWQGQSSGGSSFISVSSKNGTSDSVLIISDPAHNSSGIEVNISGTDRLSLYPNVADATTPYTFDTSLAHTSGNLMEVKNNGTNVYQFDNGGSIEIRGIVASDIYMDSADTLSSIDIYADNSTLAVDAARSGSGMFLRPLAADGNVAYSFDAITVHTSGNLIEFKNNGNLKESTSFDGVKATVGGFASTATDAAVTIATTGWTNTFGKNAVVYLDGVGLTFTVYNNALTPVYTNSVSLVGATVLLQPSGKVIITAGTMGVGRATPF